MAVKHSISPFPIEQDRNHFASWLSGFVDGEGHFGLSWQRKKTKYPRPKADFVIVLRSDDAAILHLIRSFFQCGKPIRINDKKNSNQIASFVINQVADLYKIVVPHFEKHPLIAKKSQDFSIWKEAVSYLYSVSCIPMQDCQNNRYVRKWTPERIAYFDGLISKIRNQRKFLKT